MDLRYSDADEEFRAGLREWLATELPNLAPQPARDDWDARRAWDTDWQRRLFDAGYAGINWPEEYGGRGATPSQHLVFLEETTRARAPYVGVNFVGLLHAGPTIIAEGTDEQKREHLPRILRGDEVWCQGFSEPQAGSDLASLRTRAVRDGDHYVVTGQKIWCSFGQIGDFGELLVRTDPDAPKHKGISYLLVPMKQPGVEVRGIVQPDGTAEFCEVFFTDARCAKDDVVGGINNGWKVANSTLAFERGMSATTGYRRFEEEYKLMVEAAEANGAIHDASIRQRLVQYYTKIQILRINGLRSLATALAGQKDPGIAALGASNKMFWSEMHKAAMELALDINGAHSMLVDTGSEAGSWPGTAREKRRPGYPVSAMMSAFFFSRSETIWGGTSQIQRNIVGERVLGLPKEPSAEK